jgi:hypothetical protein
MKLLSKASILMEEEMRLRHRKKIVKDLNCRTAFVHTNNSGQSLGDENVTMVSHIFFGVKFPVVGETDPAR